jgi:hypothetical protein
MAHGTSLYCPCLMVSAGSWDDQERAYGRGAYSDPPGGRQPRSRRRDPASHADVAVTYEAELYVHGGFVMSGVAGVVVGIVALVLGEIQGLIFLFSGGLVGFIGFWMPLRTSTGCSSRSSGGRRTSTSPLDHSSATPPHDLTPTREARPENLRDSL